MLNGCYLANVSTYCLAKPICRPDGLDSPLLCCVLLGYRPGGLSDVMGSLSQSAREGGTSVTWHYMLHTPGNPSGRHNANRYYTDGFKCHRTTTTIVAYIRSGL